MITIKCRQRKIKFDLEKVKVIVQRMLKETGYGHFDIGILFTTNKTIRAYNKKYRKKDKPTDILSFPYHTKLKAGQKIQISHPEDENLGVMIISGEYAKKCADDETRSLIDHVTILLAHGIAHLLGYDHQTEKDFLVMQEKELGLLG